MKKNNHKLLANYYVISENDIHRMCLPLPESQQGRNHELAFARGPQGPRQVHAMMLVISNRFFLVSPVDQKLNNSAFFLLGYCSFHLLMFTHLFRCFYLLVVQSVELSPTTDEALTSSVVFPLCKGVERRRVCYLFQISLQ